MLETKMFRGHALRIAVGITMLLLVMAQGAAAATSVSSCGTISMPGEYILTQNIENYSIGTCIAITSNDVVFDGANYTIDGVTKDNTYGVTVNNDLATLTNVIVKNLKVTDWYYGISYQNAQNGNIANNIVTLDGNESLSTIINGSYRFSSGGISLDHSNDITINNNNINSNNQSGIDLYQSSNNNILNNNIESNNFTGVMLLNDSSNNNIENNKVSKHSYQGIALSGSSNNIIINNNIENNEAGVVLGIWVINMTAGIEVYSRNNTLTNNTINSNNQSGISIGRSCNNNTLTDNTINSNNQNGISLSNSSNNKIENNRVSNNQYGIRLSSSSSNNTIYNNYFNNINNTDLRKNFDNIWSISRISGINIIGGSYLGGNVWAYPNGTGFSQTCADSDSDGICDSPYEIDSNNTDYLPLAYKSDITPTPTPTPIPTTTPLLVSAVTPNSRNAQVGMPVTIFKTVINGGTGNATGVSIKQETGLPITVSYQQWNGVSFTGLPNTPVDLPAGGIANFVLTLTPIAEFSTSSVTFNVSGTNAAPAGISAVNTLTMSASTVAPSDVIMMSTNLDVKTPVNTATAFAVATSNVGASATGVNFNVVIPSSISGLVVQVNQTNPTTGAIIGPATGLTINSGAQLTFAVFVTPTAAIASDPANNRITLQLVDDSGNIIGAQSVAVSTT